MSEKPSVIEIRDPALDEAAIRQRIAAQVAQRQAQGEYGVDLASSGPASLHRSYRETAVSLTDFSGVNEALVELMTIGTLQEPQFTSSAPVVGPLIVAIRRAWNWMSTRWYVLPLIRQQSAVNKRLIALINEMARQQEMNAHHLAQLQARVKALEKRPLEEEKS